MTDTEREEIAERLYDEFGDREDELSEHLDENVHDIFSSKASAVNNSGLEGQIEFLLENRFNESDLRSILEG